MTNFESLKEECDNYWLRNKQQDHDSRDILIEMGYDSNSLSWGMTSYDSFIDVILQVKRPKRFVVFGSGIGYQCFYWNKIFPEIPCIGVELMKYRSNWSKEMIKKYLINNVQIIHNDFNNFDIKDGDLIWQNDTLFSIDSILSLSLNSIYKHDVEIISYNNLSNNSDSLELFDKNGNLKILHLKKFKINTSWVNDNDLYYYHSIKSENNYDVTFINNEFIIPENCLKDYDSMNFSKRLVNSEKLRLLYNKNYNKIKFTEFGFNVPDLYFYSNEKCDLKPILSNLKTYVAKPAHFSESVDIFIKRSINHDIDIQKLNDTLNNRIDISDKGNWRKSPIGMDIQWKDTERGIIVEQYISVIYELKVFVVFGEPVIGDLRKGNTELYTVDFIKKENKYFNWDKEYFLIKEFAKYLKIDFFRIDFLYDGYKLYASELTFMPATILPDEIKTFIANILRMPYLKYYYPQMV